MLKKSTLARMRLATLAAAATAIAAASAGCGKQPATTQPTSQTRAAHVPSEDETTPLAGNDGGTPKPKIDPCPACGMG